MMIIEILTPIAYALLVIGIALIVLWIIRGR